MEAIACGHICVDLTPTIESDEPVSLEKFFRPGALIAVEGIDVSPGGAVANTGTALSTLGVETGLVARIGSDPFAELLRSAIERQGIEARLSRREGARTSYSLIIPPPGHDRIFFHDPGANHQFTPEDVTDEALEEAKLLHFGYPPMMRSTYLDGGAGLYRLFRRAREAGTMVSLDMALPDTDSEAGRVDWAQFLTRVLPEVDFFFPSFEEIAYMLDRSLYEQRIQQAGQGDIVDVISPDDLRLLGEKLNSLGAEISGIKAGHLGIYMRTDALGRDDGDAGNTEKDFARLEHAGGIRPREWADRELFVPSFTLDELLSATGAGDASIAGVLAGVIRGLGPKRALQIGAGAGASACRSYGATEGLMDYEQLTNAIEGGWKANDVPGLEAAGFRFDTASGVWVGPADTEYER
jgi:sugar/nucleoside kinase (ribokinase family)